MDLPTQPPGALGGGCFFFSGRTHKFSSQGKARHVGCCWTGSGTGTSSRYTWCLRRVPLPWVPVDFCRFFTFLSTLVDSLRGLDFSYIFRDFVWGVEIYWNRNIFLIGSLYRCTLSSAIEEIDYRELGVGKATFARFFFCVAVRWAGVRQTRFCCQGPLMTFYLYRVDNDQRWGLLSRASGGRRWPPMTGTNSTAWTWPTSWVMCGHWSMN